MRGVAESDRKRVAFSCRAGLTVQPSGYSTLTCTEKGS